MNQKFARPSTPMLDAARAEAAQLAQWEADEQAREARRIEQHKVEEATHAERKRVQLERYNECIQAAHDVETIADQLVAALDRYVAAAPEPVKVRIANVLHAKLGRFGPIQSYGEPDLLGGLNWRPV